MISKKILSGLVLNSANDMRTQGFDIDLEDFTRKLEAAKESYDAIARLAVELQNTPLRTDWPYEEPNDWDAIRSAMAPDVREGYWQTPDLKKAAERVMAGFTGSVCGCMLGKPVEIWATLGELRKAGEQVGEWPFTDYLSMDFMKAVGRRHPSFGETTRRNIRHVAPDDDINYSVLGMLVLEKYGVDFTHKQLGQEWIQHIAPFQAWGPERTVLLKSALNTLPGGVKEIPSEWTTTFNPGSELCGALIRADAYGYACPGNPMLASELAYRDASFTHLRTGIYATQYVAAVMALYFLMEGDETGNDRLLPFEQALNYIPRKSRFHHIASDSLRRVKEKDNWLDAYESIHGEYKAFTHCMVYQEIGTLMVTLKFAGDVGDGICKQVMTGNDTDSFGATAGSILGIFFGPGHLEERWTAPFNNRIHTTLANFHEQDLAALTERMGRLPALVEQAGSQ